LLESAGLTVITERTAPMYLLEPARLVRYERLWRTIRFLWNVAWHPVARRRILAMRRAFRKYDNQVAAIVLVAKKQIA
jgi:hypothetical protein